MGFGRRSFLVIGVVGMIGMIGLLRMVVDRRLLYRFGRVFSVVIVV